MKKSIILASVAVLALVFASCNDMLDKNPRDRFVLDDSFWSNANQVESFSNTLYENYSAYGQGGSGGWFYFKSLSDDQVNPSFDDWMFTSVPATSSYWSSPYTEIRRCNYLINGVANSSLDNKEYYIAVGRLNRAWQYFQLVRMYGDVQWLDVVIDDPESDLVNGARDDRDEVMDKVYEDLAYAAEHLTGTNKNAWNPYMAYAMMSDVCLYEGTYCKYRTAADNGKAPNLERAKTYLQRCIDANNKIMNSGNYSLSENYGDIYNSKDLSSNSEIIFYRNYEKDLLMHSTIDYTASSTQQRGISKDAFDAFLFSDGLPKALTVLSTDDHPALTPELDENAYNIYNLLSYRDQRLRVLIDPFLSFNGHTWARSGAMNMTSSTGYTIAKYDNPDAFTVAERTNTGQGYSDGPIYWLAVIYLNQAEALVELNGTISQDDLDKTINPLLARGWIPKMTPNPVAAPANNMGVSSLLWEIRRCRRCELMTDNWYRYWDLVRWHQLELLDTNKYPNINRGAYLGNVTDLESTITLDSEGYVIPITNASRTYDKKYYLCPIPSNQITLSDGTTQNPGW